VPKGVAKAHSSRIYINGEGNDYLKEYQLGLHSTMLCACLEVHAGRGPIYLDFDKLSPEDRQSCVNFIDAWGREYEVTKALDYHTVKGKQEVIWGSGVGTTGWGWGGVRVNTKCETNVAGLYAAGDAAGNCAGGAMQAVSGIGGAAVTGCVAAESALDYISQCQAASPDDKEIARLKESIFQPLKRKGGFSPSYVTEILRNLMVPYYVVQIKKGDRLEAVITMVDFVQNHLVPMMRAGDAHELRMAHEVRNMALDAALILKSSLFRTESRGTHYREDYPRRDDPAWLAWTVAKEEKGEMTLSKAPIPEKWWPDLAKPYEERYPLRLPGE
jgi:succinate dehydrogenase/fumarate reductase flavoprotein subunit